MKLQNFVDEDERFVREYDYDGTTVIAVDLGRRDAAVDVVGEVAIVAFEDGDQFELDLPAARDVNAFIRNGILTIEVNEA